MNFENNVVVVGGCGHVGLPLGVMFSAKNLRVVAYDIDRELVERVNSGQVPFREPGLEDLLQKSLETGMFQASTDKGVVSTAEHVVVVIGTPVDEHLNPDPVTVPRAIENLMDQLQDGQHLVLRSTLFPGVTRLVETKVKASGRKIDVSFCPERIAEGRAVEELGSLPQIISGRTSTARHRAETLFQVLGIETYSTTPEEAELVKLFCNSWRYIKFATVNQFFMIANDLGLDFERIRGAITYKYPRGQDMPGAGFVAGPCLFKDTLQVSAASNNNFSLGQASMMINEGLPLYIVSRLLGRYDLDSMVVGILGMSFKAESDDIRSSLSYKLKRVLRFRAKEVLCADSYVKGDKNLIEEEELIEKADLIIIGAPHNRYREIRTSKPIFDIWNLNHNGVKI